ncbi:hypothetical protein [Plantactinospora endophytica]|uniref:Uncharacterized protein n=1 Tax=Plantactinospora endophytica TaxID=673535 RepID=A0ABQ4E1V7_9ACTN|nr:hypothetical protein [Plantactinospora endophytica]GIG88699.1 hypothetical protein Pen02_36350 [Plantactinospora endophytica]
MRLRMLGAVLVAAVGLVGAFVFLARQDLEHADRYASVAAFLLALLVASVTAVAALRRRAGSATTGPEGAAERNGPEESAPAGAPAAGRAGWSFSPLFAWRNGVVIKGGQGYTHTVVNVRDDDLPD